MDFENTYENDEIQQAQDPNLHALHRLFMWWCKIRCCWTTIRSYSRKVKRSFQATTEVIRWHQMQGVGVFRRPHYGPLQVMILLSHPCFSIKIISCRAGEGSWIQWQWLKGQYFAISSRMLKSSIIAWFCDNIFHGTAEAVPTTAISRERNKYATMIVKMTGMIKINAMISHLITEPILICVIID